MNEQQPTKVLKLSETRVWRTYQGGAGIDCWRGKADSVVSNFPEDWVASTVTAINPGREDIPEGQSRVLNLEGEPLLVDVLKQNPVGYFGQNHVDAFGATSGMLIKLIDAAERLTIQVHPDKLFAKNEFHSDYGKTESWYILGTTEVDGEEPCIYFGFKPHVTRKMWEDIFEAQDIPAMLQCLHKIPVKAGDCFFIPGGLPHAIGAGCFLAEVQEPTDYTMRTELITPAGLHIHENQCHQGLGYTKMMDCFHYDGEPLEDTLKHWRSTPQMIVENKGGYVESIIDSRQTTLFQMRHLMIHDTLTLTNENQMRVWIVVKGSGVLETTEETITLHQSDYLLLPAQMECATIRCTGETLELMECLPQKAN